MRVLTFLIALLLYGLPGLAVSQETGARPRVAVAVLTLDQVRQVQMEHGRALLDLLGDDEWGQYDLAEPALRDDLFAPCRENRSGGRLDYCVRFYLTRATLPADAPPTVVVAFDDYGREGAGGRAAGWMRVVCFGRGVVPADAAVQDTWLWPGSFRVHGVRDWERDRDALAACIAAASSEPWTGLREPDVD